MTTARHTRRSETDGDDNALEKRLNRNVGERQLRKAGSEKKGEVGGQIDHQRFRWRRGLPHEVIEFRLQHHTVKHADKKAATRKSASPRAREVLQAALQRARRR